MALSKEFDPKNGFMGGISIKPMGINNNTSSKATEIQKADPIITENKEIEPKVKQKTEPKPKKEIKNTEKKEEPIKQTVNKEVVKKDTTINKGGRPKKYDVEKIRTTLFIPEDLLKEMDIAKIRFNGSRTDYILHLVKKDLEENKSEYDALKKIFKK